LLFSLKGSVSAHFFPYFEFIVRRIQGNSNLFYSIELMEILSLSTIIVRISFRVHGPQLRMSHQEWQIDCPQRD